MITYTCPHCGKNLNIRDQYAGKKGKCNHCGGSITSPAKTSSLPEVDGQVAGRLGIRFSLLMGAGICAALIVAVGFMLTRPTQAITPAAPVIEGPSEIPIASSDIGRAGIGPCVEINANHTYTIPPSSSEITALMGDALAVSLTGDEALIIRPQDLGFSPELEAFTLSFWMKLTASSSQNILRVSAGRGSALFETAPDRTDEIWYSLEAGLGDSVDGQVFEEGAWAHIALHVDHSRGIMTFTQGRPSLTFGVRNPIAITPFEEISFRGLDTSAEIELSNIKICAGPVTRSEIRDDLFAMSDHNPQFSIERLEGVISSLETHFQGTTLISDRDPQIVDRLSEGLFNLERSPGLLQRAADIVHTYEDQHGPFFVSPKGDFTRRDVGELEWAIYRLQQGVLDYGFTDEASSFPVTRFQTTQYFPGTVGVDVPRLAEYPVSISATHQLPTAYHIHQDEKKIVQMTGLYVPPGEIVTIQAPAALIGKEVEVRVGAHDEQYDIWETQERFPRVLTRFELNAERTQVANPFGGNLLFLIPKGLELGIVEVIVSGAVEAPHYFNTSTRQTSLEQWRSLRTQAVPWAQISGKNFMFSIPSSMLRTFDDPQGLVEAWDLAMDGFMELVGRPTERHRAEYFIADVRNPAGSFGPGYPTIMGGYEPEMLDAGWNPLKLLDPTEVMPNSSNIFIVLHEYGHGHYFPTLPGETEVNVNLTATYIYHEKLGYSFDELADNPIDGAFMQSIHQQLTRDEAAVNWMITQNFAANRPMGADEDHPERFDQRSYQSRGFAKYVDFAALFGWETLADSYRPYIEDDLRTGGVTLGIDPYEWINYASMAADVNMLPLFHFWGVITPEPTQLQEQAQFPPSDKIRDRLLHYLSLIPANRQEFDAHRAQINDRVTDSWQEFYDHRGDRYTEAEGQQAIDHLSYLIKLYYPDTAVEYDEESPALPMSNRVPIFVLAGQSNAEGNARLAGLKAIRDALPSHDEPLNSMERAQLRAAYRVGTGDWCNPAEDYSDEAADASIDALRASGLDLSAVSEDYTINGASMAAYRWRFQEASEPLTPPYQHAVEDSHTGHTTAIKPLGPGFGVWDDDDPQVLFYGPELGFGLRLAQSSTLEEFSMVKVAMGGSSLSAHWAPNGPLRRQLYERTNDHLSALPQSYVAGLIWFQGFNDQFDESAREAYATNLTQLIREFRMTYGEVPVVIVQARKVGGLSLIADAQHTVANTLDGVSLVESDGLSECFHYDSTSQLVIGQRSADAMVKLLNEMTEE